jgi:hypothetical protein
VNMPPGCPFAPRCPLHIAECDKAEPPLFEVGDGHTAACIRTGEVEEAHGRAAKVFSETASDALLAGEALAPGDDEGAHTVIDISLPAGEMEPLPVMRGETGSIISSHRDTTDGDRR